MSVIGPRPQLVRDMVFMTPEQRMRHTAKPGLSGLAQVNGRNAISWEDKIRCGQSMANWCIRLAEEYLSVLYDHLHKELYFYHIIQADETPVLVNHDGRKAGSKSWMWVYRSGHLYQKRQIVLYEYQQTRNAWSAT